MKINRAGHHRDNYGSESYDQNDFEQRKRRATIRISPIIAAQRATPQSRHCTPPVVELPDALDPDVLELEVELELLDDVSSSVGTS
ncbi:MAG: hypothetical protein KDA92_07790, partial [Planctomycetales bacterium]|nr:hypothetical protein [Planctomycetales bacterium]